jgi:tetratricopeptide (TPR) repeat protein
VKGETVGPYRLLAELGSGGMGTVYEAERTRDRAGKGAGRRFAVKVIHSRLLESPGIVRRFLREAEIGRAVRHPNVVRTLDAGSEPREGGALHYLVMEFVRGQTLRALLRSEGALPEELCRHVGREVARGLEAVHGAGVVHRDLKPENVLITHDQEVRVMDLGVARLRDEATRLTRTGMFVGSVQYAAPEQLRGSDAEVDPRADLYALGVVLWEAAAGRHPFPAEDLASTLRRILMEDPQRLAAVNPRVSPFLEDVVHRLLAKRREDRFPSAREVADVLAEGEACTWWRCRSAAAPAGGRRPLRRVRVPRDTPLVGREEETALLRERWDRTREGNGQVVLVEGEAGIGKTRLVDEFVGGLAADGEDLDFLFGSHPPLGAATAAGAIASAFRDHFGAAGLEASLRPRLEDAPDACAALAAVLRGDTPRGGTEPPSREALASLLVRLLRSLAADRPVVLLVDDLHFAPEQGRALFAALAMAAADLRVLLVGTARPGLPREWSSGLEHLPHAVRLSVPRLGPRDLSRLLVAALGSETLAGDLQYTIARKSDGNPYFVFELLRGLSEGRILTRAADGSWQRTRVLADLRIPSTILDLIQARLADLPEEDRDILEVAACCGFEFDPLLVGDVLEVPAIPVLKRLGRLERERGLVRSAGVHFVFDHHQVQEALTGGLSELLRREYHGALAEALERRSRAADAEPADLDGATAFRLADHFLHAGRGDRALRFVERALDYLEANFLNDAAVALAERVQAVPGLLEGRGRLRVLIRKAERLELIGRWEEERRTLEEALADADASGDPAARSRVRRRLGRHFCRMAHYPEAMEVLLASLSLAERAGDRREEGATLGTLGVVCWHLGRYEEALAYQERTRAAAEEVGDLEADFTSTGNLPDLYAEVGRYEEALGHTSRHLEISRENGDLRGEAVATGNLGGLLYDRGEYGKAGDLFGEALRLAREIGDRRGEARAAGNLGRVLRDTARTAAALEMLDRSLCLAREIGYRRGEARALAHLARVDRDLALPARAEERVRHLLEIARSMGASREEALALREIGALAGADGRPEEARAAFLESLALWGESGRLAGRASTHLAFARFLEDSGASEEALRHLDESFSLASRAGGPDEAVLSAALRAALRGTGGERALGVFESLGIRMRSPERMEACWLLWRTTGERRLLLEGRRLAAAFLEHAPPDRRDALPREVPLLRALEEEEAEVPGGARAGG